MLKKLYELAKQVFRLTTTTEQNKADIKELRQEVRDLARALQRVVFELETLRREWGQYQELNESKFENLTLRLENIVLRLGHELRERPESRKELGEKDEKS
jgi:chromosome segregation ATPase